MVEAHHQETSRLGDAFAGKKILEGIFLGQRLLSWLIQLLRRAPEHDESILCSHHTELSRTISINFYIFYFIFKVHLYLKLSFEL